MFLPQSSSSSAPANTWDDYQGTSAYLEATADINGNAQVLFPAVPENERWLVDRVVCSTSTGWGTGSAWFLMYLDSAAPQNLIDGTNAGDFDVNDADSPIEIPAGSALLCTWQQAAPAALCTARIHYLRQRKLSDGV